jgi:hypothetical protein
VTVLCVAVGFCPREGLRERLKRPGSCEAVRLRVAHYMIAYMAENLRVECSIHSLPTKNLLKIKRFLAGYLLFSILDAKLGASEHILTLKFLATSLGLLPRRGWVLSPLRTPRRLTRTDTGFL